MDAQDANGDQIYEMTCLAKNKNDAKYQSGVSCQVKRNTVMLKHTSELKKEDGNPVQIELVGVTNPNSDGELTATYRLFVMDTGTAANVKEHAKEIYKFTNLFKSKPVLQYNLYEVSAKERALRATDDYSFNFDLTGTATTVTLTHEAVKFIVVFPDDYSIHPSTLGTTDANEQKVGDCQLYERNYLSSGTPPSDEAYYSND
jgi:hypothetical protein